MWVKDLESLSKSGSLSLAPMCMIRSRIGWRRVGFLAGGVGEARLLLSTLSEFPEPLVGGFGLRQLAAMKEHSRAMFVVV